MPRSSLSVLKLKQTSELGKATHRPIHRPVRPALPGRVFPYPVCKPTVYTVYKKPVPLTSIKGFESYATHRPKPAAATSQDVVKSIRSNVESSNDSPEVADDPLSLAGPSPKPDPSSSETTDVIVPVLGDDGDYDDIAADDDDDDIAADDDDDIDADDDDDIDADDDDDADGNKDDDDA